MNNTDTDYGYISIFLHWVSALAIFALFALGYYMVDLDYYHRWYTAAPALHKSIGMMFLTVMLARMLWRFQQVSPSQLSSHSSLEKKAGKIIHSTFYVLILMIMFSGYLIATADGHGIDIFTLFIIPSLGSFIENQADIAGIIHKWLAYLIIALALLHALAAMKHHVIDKDHTLNRIIGKRLKMENKK